MQGGTTVGFWGKLVFQLRKEHKMSQRQLANAAGVNRATLRHLEIGMTVGTSISVIERILSVLCYELEAIHCDTAKVADKFVIEEKFPPKEAEARSTWARKRLLDFSGGMQSSA